MDAGIASILAQGASSVGNTAAGQTDPMTGWIVAGAGAAALGYLYLRGRARKKSDPLSDPGRMSTAQQKHLERQMQSLVVELSEMARSMSAQIDTRAAKLNELILQADKKIEELKQLQGKVDAAARSVEGQAHMSLVADDRPTAGVQGMATNQDVLLAHAEVYQLADLGNSVAEISRRVGKPAGEIELVLSLRKGSRRVAL